MQRPFSAIVTTEQWRAEAIEWIVERAGEADIEITGEIEQRRVRPWSTQLVAPSTTGPLWFKATTASMRFEAALHAELAALLPDDVDVPLAIHAEHGWILTRDRGATLGDSREPSASDWAEVAALTARMQRRLAPHGDRLLATGLPDCSPETVPDRFDRLVRLMSELVAEHPAHLAPDTVDELVAVRDRIVEATVVLAEGQMPVTWQHGDLHPWNVFATETGLRVFDLGDGQWAPAVEVLRVPESWITQRYDHPWEPILEAYLEPWGLSPADADELVRAASLTHPVNRALTWWACLECATAQEWAEWGEAPSYHLQGVLIGGS